jgi:acetate kinase
MNLLVLNSGSSSVKYKLFDMQEARVLAHGILEQIGDRESRLTHRWRTSDGHQDERIDQQAVADHHEALERIGAVLRDTGVLSDPDRLGGIAHRVMYGAEAFREPVIITDTDMDATRNNAPLDQAMEVQATGSDSRILIVRSDEELEIARQSVTLIAGTARSGTGS